MRRIDELTDEELNQYIRTRLEMAGVDLSVIPEDDSTAPADRVRIFRSARAFLRGTVATISRFPLDSQDFPPILYPAALVPAVERDESGESGGSR